MTERQMTDDNIGIYSAELISTRDPWPIAATVIGLANLVLLVLLVLR